MLLLLFGGQWQSQVPNHPKPGWYSQADLLCEWFSGPFPPSDAGTSFAALRKACAQQSATIGRWHNATRWKVKMYENVSLRTVKYKNDPIADYKHPSTYNMPFLNIQLFTWAQKSPKCSNEITFSVVLPLPTAGPHDSEAPALRLQWSEGPRRGPGHLYIRRGDHHFQHEIKRPFSKAVWGNITQYDLFIFV